MDALTVLTDGSFKNNKAGSGVVIYQQNNIIGEITAPLGNKSIDFAELNAILAFLHQLSLDTSIDGNIQIPTNKFQSFTVYCLLFIVYCLLFIVYCLLFIVYCLLFIVDCLLFIVYCLLFIVYCLLFIVYWLLFIVYCLLFIVYCLLFIVY